MKKFKAEIANSFQEHRQTLDQVLKNQKNNILKSSKMISNCLKRKGTVFWCGNGGSASDSLHLSAELIGRFHKKRKPLRSISLAGNSSTITCISFFTSSSLVFGDFPSCR